jgi:alpha-L-fucosidase
MTRLFQPLFFFILTAAALSGSAQTKVDPAEIEGKMQWFADAKLGIFIHTGIYAVNGIDESWSFHNRKISHADYMKQVEGFSMSRFDPAAWAELIEESGARYAVITTKHHDGVAMYDTRMNDLSIVKASPAKMDMIAPFFAELRQRGIKCGAYYSLIDWTHADYPGLLRDSARYRVEEDYRRWYRFRDFFQGQIDEVLTMFNPDLWWFDGDWEHSAERWEAEKIRHRILAHNSQAILNGRLQGYGDYATPEQNFPVSRPKHHWWELCMTTNNNWGFQPRDTAWKTPYEIISIFVDAVSNGGNLLLNIGPRADGSIPAEPMQLLKTLGAWNKKHGEAIFNTIPGLPPGHFYGPSTLSKDSTTLYLFLSGNPQNQVVVRGLFDAIESISVVGTDTPVDWKIVGKISWSPVPGLVFIEVPAAQLDPYMTVLKVQLKGPLSLYRGEGGLGG